MIKLVNIYIISQAQQIVSVKNRILVGFSVSKTL